MPQDRLRANQGGKERKKDAPREGKHKNDGRVTEDGAASDFLKNSGLETQSA